jgi:hypothetical protein
MNPFKLSAVIAATLLGATAMGVAIMLARDPELLKKLVKQGALSYHRAATLIAEVREELGDVVAEAMQEAEEELRAVDIADADSGADGGRASTSVH